MAMGAPPLKEQIRNLKKLASKNELIQAKALLEQMPFVCISLAFKLIPKCSSAYCNRRLANKDEILCAYHQERELAKKKRKGLGLKRLKDLNEKADKLAQLKG